MRKKENWLTGREEITIRNEKEERAGRRNNAERNPTQAVETRRS